ncbi:hypothetical protein B0T24DRAFT_553079 [Lasiosphaeria ovina]|uniref:VOC domain-containing protein n=1 Tax=Lasiosphaeria ovina TaxID=92902 RepID=A0AAE0N7X7_9PEZI|nr:hypothetical protein B0T24DRAFT_553079 [Lasiosphaeria ovina]
MALATAHLRIARPTNNLDALLPFYCNGLGFEMLGSFPEHEGFSGIMLGHKSAGYHLEFTQKSGHDAGRAPTQDNLLVFYLPDGASFAQAVTQMEQQGFAVVRSFNPYWDRCGKSFEDPDGYRVVLANMTSPNSDVCLILLTAVAAAVGVKGQQTGYHVDWPRWCGKVYQDGYPSFDPGGQTLAPSPAANGPLVHVQFQPRYSLYLESEKHGEVVVNAALSPYHGKPWPSTNTTSSTSGRANNLIFSINLVEDDAILVQNTVAINSTGNVFRFDLSRLKPSLEPIKLVLYGAPEGGRPTWTATSSLFFLPEKTNGSVTRIDNFNGGLFFRNAASGHRFQPLLPHGFYASYDGFLGNNSTSEIQHYADLGLNSMTPLTIYRDSAPAFAYMDKINLKFMYNLREGYKNLTYVREQVLAAKDAEAIYSYWGTDEPDGWQDPFDAPSLARDLIRQLDPYHPVAITLNCQNYHFAEYSAGGDIIMEDVYPIGINSTWSKWHTACNATLGDCGCDNCQGNLQDVPNRLDDYAAYESWLGLWPKTKAHNPQSFHGEDYWLRDPSVDEELVMNALALNHGAQALVSWVWPASAPLGAAHGAMAKVVAASPVVDFLVGGDRPHPAAAESAGSGAGVIDAAYWVVGKKMLVSVVNGGYVDISGTVAVAVPNAIGIASTPWGDVGWRLQDSKLTVPVLPALATSMVILELR